MVSWVTIEGFWIYLVGSNEWVTSNWILVFTHRFLGSPRGQHCNSLEGNQGFHLRPEAGRFVRSFAIPRPVLWDQYWQFFFTTVNGVSEYSILKISWGSMPPDPPRCLRLRRSRGALRRQENIHVRCFQKYVRYFTKQLKTLRKCMTTGCSDVQINDFSERFSLFRRSFIRNWFG